MERRYEVFVIMDSVIWNLIMSMQRSLMKNKSQEEDKKEIMPYHVCHHR